MKRAGVYVRLGVFLVAAGFLAVMELTTLTGPHTGDTDTYHATFGGKDGVSGLRAGNPVKVAGVPVGKVTAIDLVNATTVRVSFTANHDQQLTSSTWAVVRYANLLGQRYLALTRPAGPDGAALRPGGTIPQSRTQPALSLTDLFNGFQPLFAALTPDEVNDLSEDIIGVLQGETSRVDDLVARTADLTADLGDRAQTFAQVLGSLSSLLSAVSQHDTQLASVVTSLSDLTTALQSDAPAILGSLDAVDQLIGSSAGLLGRLQQHNFGPDLAAAASTTGVIAGNTTALKQVVSGFADAFSRFDRISQNGNWVNVYLCNLTVHTYGTVSVTAGQAIGTALTTLLNDGGTLAGVISGLLGPIGAAQMPVGLALPNGTVGGMADNHTAVCR